MGNFYRESLGTGYRPKNIPNTSIKWESQEQWNVGLDLGFIQDRINVVVDWYKKVSNDMLMALQLPSYMGTQGNTSSRLDPRCGNFTQHASVNWKVPVGF